VRIPDRGPSLQCWRSADRSQPPCVPPPPPQIPLFQYSRFHLCRRIAVQYMHRDHPPASQSVTYPSRSSSGRERQLHDLLRALAVSRGRGVRREKNRIRIIIFFFSLVYFRDPFFPPSSVAACRFPCSTVSCRSGGGRKRKTLANRMPHLHGPRRVVVVVVVRGWMDGWWVGGWREGGREGGMDSCDGQHGAGSCLEGDTRAIERHGTYVRERVFQKENLRSRWACRQPACSAALLSIQDLFCSWHAIVCLPVAAAGEAKRVSRRRSSWPCRPLPGFFFFFLFSFFLFLFSLFFFLFSFGSTHSRSHSAYIDADRFRRHAHLSSGPATTDSSPAMLAVPAAIAVPAVRRREK